jgi:hypothetical protein
MYKTIEENPGCLGINPVKTLREKRLDDNRFVVDLGRANTKNRDGVFIHRLSQELIDIYNSRPSYQRLVCLRIRGKDSVVGQSVSTTMMETHEMVCATVASLKLREEPGGIQVVSGVIKIDGPKGSSLSSLIEDDIGNRLIFGHRYVGDRGVDGFKTTNIVGYDLVASVL